MLTNKEIIKIVKQLGMMPLLYKMRIISYNFKHPVFESVIQKYGGVDKWMLSRLAESENELINILDSWEKQSKRK